MEERLNAIVQALDLVQGAFGEIQQFAKRRAEGAVQSARRAFHLNSLTYAANALADGGCAGLCRSA